MVRQGKYSDLDHIVDMACRFWNTGTVYSEPACPDTIRDMAEGCIAEGMMSVLEVSGSVVGFACGVVGPLVGTREALAGTELAWWVDPNHRSGRNGISLLKHLEGLAKDRGVKYWNMAFMESSMPEKVEKIYQRLGYAPVETLYGKVL